MWNKPTGAKPSSQDFNGPVPPPNKPQEAPRNVSSAPPSSFAQSTSSFAPSTPQSVAETVTAHVSKISSGLKIQGEITGTSDLYIDGEAQGKIRLTGSRVTVGPNGRVQSDIEAREIVVEGSVQGNLKAGERLRLGGSSRVQGMMMAPRIGIDDGARYRGKVEVTRVEMGRPTSVSEPAIEAEALKPVSVNSDDE